MNKLFAYGTLKDPVVLKEILSREILGIPDTLVGYSKGKIKIDGKFYPRIVLKESEEVTGLVIEVSREELKKIDVYETTQYRRVLITLKSGISAWVYS